MKIHIITIFPEMFRFCFDYGVVSRAIRGGQLELDLVDLRSFTMDPHRTVDDRPYGGGEGMVFKPEPLAAAIRSIKTHAETAHVVYLTPQGQRLDQQLARKLTRFDQIILICGRYEGIDQRIIDLFVDEEISIGDYVLSGGEIPAMVLVDVTARLLPGVVGHPDSIRNESFESAGFDYPVYTRPAVFDNCAVPEVLLSGDHKEIQSWRRQQALERTSRSRPDLLSNKIEKKNSP